MFERYLDVALCSALLLDPDGITLRHRSASSLPAAYTRATDGVEIGPGVASWGTAAYCGQLVIIEDTATDPLWTDYRDLALAHGLRICWTIPILSSQSRQVLGIFAMYYGRSRRPSPEDRSLIERSKAE